MATFPLHKSPTGLLETFRLRTLGANPNEFGGTVLPVVDITAYYAADKMLVSSSSPSVGSLANLTEELEFTAPCRIRAISAELMIGAAAGTNVFIACGFNRISAAGAAMRAATAQVIIPTTIIGGRYGVGSPLGEGWIAMPGTRVWARATGTAAGVDHSLSVFAVVEALVPD